jgi:hypothetical protein
VLGAGAEPPNARLLRWTRTVMLVEAVDERAHAVVPQLHDAVVQGAQHPWTRSAQRKQQQQQTRRGVSSSPRCAPRPRRRGAPSGLLRGHGLQEQLLWTHGWKLRPFTRFDLVSNLVNMACLPRGAGTRPRALSAGQLQRCLPASV